MARKKPKKSSNTIVSNKKARHDYFIEEHLEAGLVLEGWEVKSLREGKGQLVDSYVLLKGGEAYLLGCVISPLLSASTHVEPDPSRTRKLLLHKDQITKLISQVDRKGYAVVALSLYWKKGRVKVDIGIAKGKKDYDKRAVQKDRDWQRTKQRILKHG